MHTSPAGRMAVPVRARRVSFGPVAAGTAGQTTERALAMFDARTRRNSIDPPMSPSSPSWSTALGRPQPAPASPSWSTGLDNAAPAWRLATPTPHATAAAPALLQQHDPAALKAAVDAYMTSPTYDRFVESLCADATRAIDDCLRDLTDTRVPGARVRRGSRDPYAAIAVPSGPVPLAVFDVDDTLLSSHPGRRHRFAAHLLSAGTRMPPAYLPPIDPVVRLYRSLRARGVRTAILTGRRSTNEAVTLDNLRWAGVDGWDHAIFRAVGTPEQHMDAVDYKSRQRARLAAAGYRIVANVGDQHSDLHGGNSGVAVKLPNPMHTIP